LLPHLTSGTGFDHQRVPAHPLISGAAGNNIFLSKDYFDRVYLSKSGSASEKRMSLFSQGGDRQV
jgi:hypothetical protein